MTLHIIIGAQWGDEGKGRIVDHYAARAQVTARFNGGDNAGHTVTVGERIFKLHLIPSGIIHPHVTAVMGNGMVVNPRTLLEEMDSLMAAGVPVSPQRLRISHAAHLITPAHQALDKAQEAARGKGNIGTTGRGIGPAYTDKSARRGLRMGDMLAGDFRERIADHIEDANRTLAMLDAPILDPGPVCDEYRKYSEFLKDHIADISVELDGALKAGKTILAEGAQGSLLDIDFGTYPFVTSSNTVAPGALTGLGLGLDAARQARVTGVVKAFQTRVGSGPFPTELGGDLALRLRGSGSNPWDEYGATTGRPRRVGWLDGVLLRYSARINGLSELVITKLDILSGLESLRICTAYRRDKKHFIDLPFGPADLAPYEPVYEELPGWEEDVSGVRRWKDLPKAAKHYIEQIAKLAGVPVKLVSVGPERKQVLEI
ncbi:MAG: adenylosuccinate synthase [Chloroflexi bacterium]|nr:adenylosuccinate synthase [Chloroflexota bacterium]